MEDIAIFVGAVVGVSLALGVTLKGLEWLEGWATRVFKRTFR